jgi:hypothetical protein
MILRRLTQPLNGTRLLACGTGLFTNTSASISRLSGKSYKKTSPLCDRPYPKSAAIDLQGFRSGAMNEILSKSGKD